MRLSHFALALTIILLAITGYLAWEAQEEARGARRELELVRKQQAARDVATPIKPTTVTSLPPPPEVPASAAPAVPPLAGSGLMPGTPVTSPSPAPAAAPLTALQKQLLGMPAMAKVIEIHNDQGFAVISAGKDKQLSQGMKFDVRRGDGLVGRVIVGDTIEASEAVVDIDSTVALPGVRIEVGDELILPIRK
ncbi:hypothetical protein [Prosthecobacter sp.]|uniref:hypothetical protein n=1 Tax=Prosthecobacter sp. TaxID=1965333 RepID=UPI002AB7FD1B|nr:hypothetical protein [Prosthecobacter sp.]MDZ4405164.1 hypothetical protein [Prosthecobacter sp.]